MGPTTSFGDGLAEAHLQTRAQWLAYAARTLGAPLTPNLSRGRTESGVAISPTAKNFLV
jgi:hypothetical protein